jgi:hypothetical protein
MKGISLQGSKDDLELFCFQIYFIAYKKED